MNDRGADACTHVADDDVFVRQLPALARGGLDGHGAHVEGMARGLAANFRQAGELGNVFHLIHHHGVIDVGGDVQRLGDFVRQQRPEVGGVVVNGPVPQKVQHAFINKVRTLQQRGQFAATPGHGGELVQVKLLFLQRLQYGIQPDGKLGNVVLKTAQGFCRMIHLFLEQKLMVLVNGNPRRGGTGIDGKNGIVGFRHVISLWDNVKCSCCHGLPRLMR